MSLTEKLADGGFLSLVELDPPKGADPAGFIARAKAAAKLADGLVVSDMSDAVMRMSALGGALILHKEGLAPICSVSPAHKNRLAIEGELLAASALGLNDVLVVRGEEPKAGDHHEAQPVNDLTLQQVLECLDALAQGRDFAGHALEGAAQFSVGCAIDLWTPGRMDGPKTEIARRASAGAEYFVTPPSSIWSTFWPSRKGWARTRPRSSPRCWSSNPWPWPRPSDCTPARCTCPTGWYPG